MSETVSTNVQSFIPEIAPGTGVKCGNRKGHAVHAPAYHATKEDVRSCYALSNSAPPAPCCDGTGWTGEMGVLCDAHYEPSTGFFELGHGLDAEEDPYGWDDASVYYYD